MGKIKAILSQVDGTSREVAIKGDIIKELQKLVGGQIEVVRYIEISMPGVVMVVNKEAEIMGLHENTAASIICNRAILGDAVIIAERNNKFDTLFKDDKEEWIRALEDIENKCIK